MPAPFDYTQGFVNPSTAILQGVQAGLGIQNARTAAGNLELQQQQEGRIAAQQQTANELARQKFEADQRAVQERQSRITALFNNPKPTAADFINAMDGLSKEQQEALSGEWGKLGKERQRVELKQAGDVLAMLSNQKPDMASETLREYAEAARNAGDETSAQRFDNYADLVEENPDAAMKTIGALIAPLEGGKDVLENVFKVTEEERKAAAAPGEREAREATTGKTLAETEKLKIELGPAAVAAKYAESKAVADLKLTEAQTAAIAAEPDIKRQNSAIAVERNKLDALGLEERSRENDLRAEELRVKIKELEMKRDELTRQKKGEFDAVISVADNQIATIDEALNTPIDVIESATGPVSSRIPTLAQDTANFEEIIETIKAQTFLNQIPNMTGKGALSDAEGKKLESSVRSLSIRQSPEKLLANLREIKRLTEKGRARLSGKYGLEAGPVDTGGTPAQTLPSGATVEWIE